jgi:hypothetical protein
MCAGSASVLKDWIVSGCVESARKHCRGTWRAHHGKLA